MTWKPPFWKRPARAGRQLYVQAFAALQGGWLAAHRHRFNAQRRRSLHRFTAFGSVAMPIRVVREKAAGRYLTPSKVLLRQTVTRLLCPALEQAAIAFAYEAAGRPARRSRCRGARVELDWTQSRAVAV